MPINYDIERAHVEVISHFNLLDVHVRKLERAVAENPKDERLKRLAENHRNSAMKFYRRANAAYLAAK